MNYLTMNSVEEFHKIFRAFRSHKGFGNWFRGPANADWNILPKAGRAEYFLPNNRDFAIIGVRVELSYVRLWPIAVAL
jgi:hypothetical protein